MASKPLVVACDLTKDQRLYRVPAWGVRRLARAGVRVVPVKDGRLTPAVRGADAWWGNFFEKSYLPLLPRLRWIHCASVGVNRAAVPEVAARGIVVTNSRGILSASVATATVGMLCSLARHFQHGYALCGRGKLDRAGFEPLFDRMHDLQGERLLVVGLGDSGRRVAAACHALGMRVSAIKNRPAPKPAYIERFHRLSALASAVRDADFVVNLLPLTEETREVFDARVFNAMKKGSFFLNIGRGPTVDEAALARALRSGRLAGAGLDVFAVEPLPKTSPLWKLPQVLLMPHVACLSPRYWPEQIDMLAENARRFKAGRRLVNAVDIGRGY